MLNIIEMTNTCENCYLASQDFRKLVELTDVTHTEHPGNLDVVGHFLFDINEDLTYRGIRGPEGSENYLNRRIHQIKDRIPMFQDSEAVEYLNKVMSLMENIRDAGINLPCHESRVW